MRKPKGDRGAVRLRMLNKIERLYGARGRGRTGTAFQQQDFKSCVSTNFTTRALGKRKTARSVTVCSTMLNAYREYTVGLVLEKSPRDILARYPDAQASDLRLFT
jgi:hypothetical protein